MSLNQRRSMSSESLSNFENFMRTQFYIAQGPAGIFRYVHLSFIFSSTFHLIQYSACTYKYTECELKHQKCSKTAKLHLHAIGTRTCQKCYKMPSVHKNAKNARTCQKSTDMPKMHRHAKNATTHMHQHDRSDQTY